MQMMEQIRDVGRRPNTLLKDDEVGVAKRYNCCSCLERKGIEISVRGALEVLLCGYFAHQQRNLRKTFIELFHKDRGKRRDR